MLTTAYIKAGIAALAVAGLMFSGWAVRGWYDGSLEAARLTAEQETRDVMREISGEIAGRTEEAIKGIRIENRTIYNDTQREIIKEPVYSDCVLPDTGRLLVNHARSRAAASKPDVPVRTDGPAR